MKPHDLTNLRQLMADNHRLRSDVAYQNELVHRPAIRRQLSLRQRELQTQLLRQMERDLDDVQADIVELMTRAQHL